VALVRTNVSEEHIASIIRVRRIGELGKTLAVTSNDFLNTIIVSLYTILRLVLLKYSVSETELSPSSFKSTQFRQAGRADPYTICKV
jgi:hypothetical protein